MVVGFLKGIWGKPAQKATGVQGLWGTVTSAPGVIMGKLMSPAKLIMGVAVLFGAFILFKRFK